jgi:hypothetical protein
MDVALASITLVKQLQLWMLTICNCTIAFFGSSVYQLAHILPVAVGISAGRSKTSVGILNHGLTRYQAIKIVSTMVITSSRLEVNCTGGAGGHGVVMLLVCLHISAKLELAVFGVIDFHSGHNSTGLRTGDTPSSGGKFASHKLLE